MIQSIIKVSGRFPGHIHIDLLNTVYHANLRTSQERFQPQIAKKERSASAPKVDVFIKKKKKVYESTKIIVR